MHCLITVQRTYTHAHIHCIRTSHTHTDTSTLLHSSVSLVYVLLTALSLQQPSLPPTYVSFCTFLPSVFNRTIQLCSDSIDMNKLRCLANLPVFAISIAFCFQLLINQLNYFGNFQPPLTRLESSFFVYRLLGFESIQLLDEAIWDNLASLV